MSHRSLPPSASRLGTLQPASLLRMMRPTPTVATAAESHDAVSVIPLPKTSPRVRVIDAPGGTITIVGVTLAGEWVAEFRCLAQDFDERCVVAMERRVLLKERDGTHAKVIPFTARAR